MFDLSLSARLAGVAVTGAALVGSLLLFLHAFSVDHHVARRFEQHPACAGALQRDCFRHITVRVVGGHTEETVKPPATYYYLALVRADGQQETREVDSSIYDQLRAAGQATARTFNGRIVSLTVNGSEYATDLYPSGGLLYIILGTIAIILSGAAFLIALLELCFPF